MKMFAWLNKYKILMFFIICFSIPMVAAKLALAFSWYTPGATNKGQWLRYEIYLSELDKNSGWHLVYVQPRQCAKACELTQYTLQQLYAGLGKHQSQVSATKVNTTGMQSNLEGELLIVNPRGLVLLHYPGVTDLAQAPALAKAIRSDLLRLLNYDRSGL